jgi:hypothetical protein
VIGVSETYRQVHLDFHTSPLIRDVGSEFRPEEFVEMLRRASVNSVTVFAKCHHGMSYYDTRVGVKHPALKTDLLGEMVEACHSYGIRVAAYYSVCWDSHIGEQHPEWLQVGLDGSPLRPKPFERPYYSWETLCLNSPYTSYVKAQIEEIMGRYEVDGIFLDIVSQRRPGCICRYCRESMASLGLDYSDQDDLRLHSRIVEERFMKDVRAIVEEKRASASIFFNGMSNLNMARMAEPYMSHFEIESLPTGPWGYYHFPFYARYLRNFGKPLVGMTGRFHTSWADFGGLKPSTQLLYEVGRILGHGCAVSVGDQMHPRGFLDRAVYENIGAAYRVAEVVEKVVRGSEPVYEAAILALPRTRGPDKYVLEGEVFGVDDSLAGAVKLLLEEKVQFGVIDPWMDFSKYRLLIIPDRGLLDDEVRSNLSQYISSGGRVLLSYRATLEDGVIRCPGVDLYPVGEDRYDVDFFRVEPAIGEGLPTDFDIAMYGSGIYCEMRSGTALARIREPYFRRSFREYTSHTYTPAAKSSPYPAVALSQDHKVIYIYSQIFAAYYRYGYSLYRKLVRNCVNLLLGERLVLAEAPSSTEAYLWSKDDSHILHIVNFLPSRVGKHPEYMDEYYPPDLVRLRIRAKTEPRRVYSPLTGGTPLHHFRDGYVELAIRSPPIYDVFIIEYG